MLLPVAVPSAAAVAVDSEDTVQAKIRKRRATHLELREDPPLVRKLLKVVPYLIRLQIAQVRPATQGRYLKELEPFLAHFRVTTFPAVQPETVDAMVLKRLMKRCDEGDHAGGARRLLAATK